MASSSRLSRSGFSRLIPLFLLTASAAVAPAQKVVSWGTLTSVPDGLRPTKVEAGNGYSLALNADGSVTAWGYNDYGPMDVPAGLVAKDISAGAFNAFALRPDGTVAVWGSDYYNLKSVPDGLVATQLSGGTYQAGALRADGSVAAWGVNWFGQVDVPAGLVATQVSSAGDSLAAIRPDGSVIGWGNYGAGPADLRLKALDGGGNVFLGIRPDNTVTAWGYAEFGELDVPAGLTATQVSAGHFHMLALRPNGTVAAWGRHYEGQTNVPAGLTGVLQVSAGEDHSLALIAAAHCVLDQTEVFAGDAATGTVKLAEPAPAGGIVVGLVSEDATVHVPASVTIPEGETSRTFPVTTDYALGTRTAKIRTVYGATANEQRTVPFSLKVKGVTVTAALSQTSLVGGSTTKPSLTITIGSPAPSDLVLALSSDNPAGTVPATATIPAGATSVKVNLPATGIVATPTNVAVTASYRGAPTFSTTLTLQPLKALVTLESTTVTSGESTLGFVTTTAPVAQALTVPLASSLSGVTVPALVRINAGARTGYFTVSTAPRAADATTTISGTISGNAYSANLRLLAVPGLRSLTLPTAAYGNGRVTGTVRLTRAAKAGGTVVSLASSDPAVSVPATVTVPEGQYAATFQATTADVAAVTNATVTASTATGSDTSGLTVNPLKVASIAFSSAMAASGSPLTVTVGLNAVVAVDTVVTLVSADSALVPVPATVTIPAGSKTVSVQITIGDTTSAKNVKITASRPGSSLYRTVKVTP